MNSKTFIIFAVLVIAVATVQAQEFGKRCQKDSECPSKCCSTTKKRCADSPKGCPCNNVKWRCPQGEVCVNQEVQCFTTPCYPVAECQRPARG